MSRRHRGRQRSLLLAAAAAHFRESIERRGSTSGSAARTISWRHDVTSGVTVGRPETSDCAEGGRRHVGYDRMRRWRVVCEFTDRRRRAKCVVGRGRRRCLDALCSDPLRVRLDRLQRRTAIDDARHRGYVISTHTNTTDHTRCTSVC